MEIQRIQGHYNLKKIMLQTEREASGMVIIVWHKKRLIDWEW